MLLFFEDQTIEDFEKVVKKPEPYVDDLIDMDPLPPSTSQEQIAEDVQEDHKDEGNNGDDVGADESE